ncbi:hypothetical protein H0484_07430 [Pusillimonas sp. CC-YST705]|uniref:Uncharacterized protein n=1 Tax=Mesopusillimonas faecipullorum TaxID=2755040 RepID=A0ABS8CD95_9BURK|nr:hypothetical protein [Mesopusillimonas faecipullorum]MCB5363579.1 hypothetical protein [Mesopusillimonas faecipullorum]
MKSLTLLLAAFTLLVSGCGSDSSPDTSPSPTNPDTTDISNRIYVLSAQSGGASLAGPHYTITLNQVQPEVDWYTDRPERETGDEDTTSLIETNWQRVYADTAPNALLQYTNAAGVQGIFGAVSEVSYNAQARTLKFKLSLDQDPDETSPSAGSFQTPVLTLLNNLEPSSEGSSFALYADRTSVVAGNQGGYQLVLENVYDDVFWMNHAPSRAGDFETLGNFVNYWPDRFADAAPNASIAGDTGQGDYDIMPLTLSDPVYDSAARRISFTAVPLRGTGTPDIGTALKNAVLFVDAGERATPSGVFAKQWRGVAYSAVPATYNSNPTGAFFDSDVTASAFQAVWGEKDGCGRNDLQAMADVGINLVRLYDYNYQRGSTKWITAGDGHIPFLDKAQALGIKVIIPVSNYNFMRQDGQNRPWDNIEHTVAQIVNSVKKNGVIHPAVHSFSVGNELDLDKYGMTWHTLIPDAVRVVGILNKLAPDHYITIPISTADQNKFYAMFRQLLPKQLYQKRFYNSVQTFKLKDGNDLRDSILRGYDNLKLGVPLLITELGTYGYGRTPEYKITSVLGQASAVREYTDSTPKTLVKGFAIFEWQDAHWKRNGSPNDNSESTFGIQTYSGSLCQSNTGRFYMEGTIDGNHVYNEFHPDVKYSVDKLVPLTSSAHPKGLLSELSVYFK